jgi:hypothetical protein
MMGITELRQQLLAWSLPTTFAWAAGGTTVAVVNLLFGSGGSWMDPIAPIATGVLFWGITYRSYRRVSI